MNVEDVLCIPFILFLFASTIWDVFLLIYLNPQALFHPPIPHLLCAIYRLNMADYISPELPYFFSK